MIKGIIFDLDQTLVDSSIAEINRKNREWSKVYSLIPSFNLYNGFIDIFNQINNEKLSVCIVTSSPGTYAKKVVNHFNIPCDFIVDYFATNYRKPHPSPMLKALELLKLEKEEVISFGDKKIDIISSNNAMIKSVACLWGSNERELLIDSNPSFVINLPIEIASIINL